MIRGTSTFRELRSAFAQRGGRFVAVSIDSRQLRLVAAQSQRGSVRIVAMQAFDVPLGCDLSDPKVAGLLLAACLKQMHLSGSTLAFAVPRGQVVLKPLTLPPGTGASEMPAMVHFQVGKDLPFRVDEAVIDFAVGAHYDDGSSAAPAGLDVLVAALRLPALDYYREVAASAGARLGHLGLAPLANLTILNACFRSAADERLVLVHVSADETEIDIIAGGTLAFSRSAVVKVPPACDGPDASAQAVGTLINEVTRTVHSYQAMGRAAKLSAVLVMGGAGLEDRGLLSGLSQRLGVPCRLLEPQGSLPLPAVEGTGAFLPAVGLAMSYGAAAASLDFLNPKRPVTLADPQKKKLAIVAGLAIGLLVVSAGAGWWIVHARDAQNRQLAATLTQLEKDAKAVKELSDRLGAVDGWSGEGRAWLDHLAEVTGAVPPCEELYITAFSVNEDIISLTVRARGSQSLTDLNSALEEAGYRVLPGRQATQKDPYGYNQEMSLKIQVPANKKIALDQLVAAPRPADDDSLAALGANSRRPEGQMEIRSPQAEAAPQRNPAPPRTFRRREQAQAAAQPAPAAPVAAPSGEYRDVTFDFLSADAPGVDQLSATPVRLKGRIGRSGRFCLPDVTEEKYVAFGISDAANPRKVVYVFIRRESKEAQAWDEMLKKAAEVNARGGATVWGKATFSRDANRWSPVGLVVDGFSEN